MGRTPDAAAWKDDNQGRFQYLQSAHRMLATPPRAPMAAMVCISS
jgi:hypothetical protein